MGTVRLFFNRAVADDSNTTNASNYVITGGSYSITVSAATRRSGKVVDLTTSEFTTGETYTVTVSNLFDENDRPIDSSAVSASFVGAGVAPQVVSATQVDNTHVDVVFDEEVESTTAETPGNYAITGTSSPAVSAASLGGDGVTVHLTLGAAMPTGSYTATVINVTDLVDNVVDPAHDSANFSAVAVQLWTQLSPAASPGATYSHTMAYDSARDRVVMFGLAGETWEYDGSTWEQKVTVHTPGARWHSAMAYDAFRGVVVMYGGIVGGVINREIWEYDGSDWTQISLPVTSPSYRNGHSMIYDAAIQKVHLFGGWDGFNRRNDSWSWDGTTFVDITPGGSLPAGRYDHAMAYDHDNNVVVIFGGNTTVAGDARQTWEFTIAGGWVNRSPVTQPSSRHQLTMSMEYLTSRSKIVLFGGIEGSTRLDDTWEYDTTTHLWAEAFPSPKPATRSMQAMVEDSLRSRIFMFAGYNSGALSDSWQYE